MRHLRRACPRSFAEATWMISCQEQLGLLSPMSGRSTSQTKAVLIAQSKHENEQTLPANVRTERNLQPGVSPRLCFSWPRCAKEQRNASGKQSRLFWQDSLPEWSKGVDSNSTSASCVGSNPTAVTLQSHPNFALPGSLSLT